MAPEKIDKLSIPLLLEFASNLPASPRIYARLSRVVEDEDTALDFVASLVKMDPGLAAQILRVTNSAYFGATLKVNDLETAISRIGFHEVHKVLSMVVTRECFYQALPLYGITATDFCDRSIAVAVASEVAAKRVGLEADGPYIAGLLHDIGKLAISLYVDRMGLEVRLQPPPPEGSWADVEREAFGVTGWRAGYEILRHWQFEPAIWMPIKNQAAPKAAPSFVRGTAVLTLAIWMADQLEARDPLSDLPADVRWALPTLSLPERDAPSLLDAARFEIEDRRNLFSMLI